MQSNIVLKNGGQVPETIISTTIVSLRTIRRNSPGVFLEFVSACKDLQFKISQTAKQKLKKRVLMENGIIHRSVRDIVISSVNEDFEIEDPVET